MNHLLLINNIITVVDVELVTAMCKTKENKK